MPNRSPLVVERITPDTVRKWWRRIELSRDERRKHTDTWDLLIDEYLPAVSQSGKAEQAKANILFRMVEQKKPLLFFQSPEMRLTPRERMQTPVMDPLSGQPRTTEDGQPLTADTAVTIHEQVLNQHLGPDGVNLSHLMDRVLFDCLCPSGFLVTKIGYRAHSRMIKQPVMEPVPVLDPMTGGVEVIEQPVIGENGQPVTESVPQIVKEEYFWSRVSPKKLLIPHDHHDTDFERAPWLGVEFRMPLRDAKRLYRLPDDFRPTTKGADENLLGRDRNDADTDEPEVAGVEIFYKAHLFRGDVVHPEVFFQLVLLEGHEEKGQALAAVHRQSPFQELVPETGMLTPASMVGNPIHVGTLRDLSDSAYVPSDCAVINGQAKEINTYRRQTIQLRDANVPKFGYDTDKVTPEALTAIQTGDVGQYIAFQGGTLDAGMDRAIAQITRGSQSRVDLQGAFQLEQDVEKAMAMGANQAGVETATSRTATELSLIQANANVRMQKEQARTLAYALAGVRKFDALLQMFASNDEVIEIVGEDGARRLEVWNKDIIAGRFAYDIVPDSQIRVDMATERAQIMQLYNLTAQDPFIRRKETLKPLLRAFQMDPGKSTQEPPPEPPTEPKVSIAIKGEDFLGPQAPIMLELLETGGIQLSDEAKQLAGSLAIRARADALTGGPAPGEQRQPGVPGPAERIPQVLQRQGELTGQLDGGGSGTGRVT